MTQVSATLPDAMHYMRAGTLNLSSLPPLSLYVHLPWCLRKCPYCDFNSHERSGELPEVAYVQALLADLEQALPQIWGRSIHSIFIGGGTPSLFSPQAIDSLLSGLRARLRLEAACEITLEANPGTFEKDRFRDFRSAGVTRLSVGVQSFNDGFLKTLGRVHNGAQARAALSEAAECFDTFNLDLMYALPGQTLDDLKQDVQTALEFAPPHLSIYHLTIEPNTYFAKYTPANLPGDDDAYDMLDLITEMTSAQGLNRYEISAYAKPGHASQHNSNYWQFGDYLGIGAGAHSKLSFAHRVVRQVRKREPVLYMQDAMKGLAIAQEHEVSRKDLAFEFMMNALRLKEGFALLDFSERTGLPLSAIAKPLAEAQAKGLVECGLNRIVPTARGYDFLSDLLAYFLPDNE